MMALRDKRQDCFGGCGRRILLRRNPSGYCRKCQRKNALKALKLANKQKRDADDN